MIFYELLTIQDNARTDSTVLTRKVYLIITGISKRTNQKLHKKKEMKERRKKYTRYS